MGRIHRPNAERRLDFVKKSGRPNRCLVDGIDSVVVLESIPSATAYLVPRPQMPRGSTKQASSEHLVTYEPSPRAIKDWTLLLLRLSSLL